MQPQFQADGNLPPGIHWMEWVEFAQSFGQTPHRGRLMSGIYQLLVKLADAGCETVYIDGSFVSLKQIPSDFDGAWELKNVDLQRLSVTEPLLFDFSRQRAAQKRKYLGEMFPADFVEGGSGRTFLEFFQLDKQTGARKGVVAIDLRTL